MRSYSHPSRYFWCQKVNEPSLKGLQYHKVKIISKNQSVTTNTTGNYGWIRWHTQFVNSKWKKEHNPFRTKKNINDMQKMMSFYLCYTWRNELPLDQPNIELHINPVRTYQNLYGDMQAPADKTGSYEEAQLSCWGCHFLWSSHCTDWCDIVKCYTATVRNCFKQILITHTQKFYIINPYVPPFLYHRTVWYP
jgi:hypothetical protein